MRDDRDELAARVLEPLANSGRWRELITRAELERNELKLRISRLERQMHDHARPVGQLTATEWLAGSALARERRQGSVHAPPSLFSDGKDAPPDPGSELPLPAPRDPRDDLRAIRGIGPTLEHGLFRLGIFRYWQLARLRDPEIEWLARRLRFSATRIRREDWVSQARELDGGGPERDPTAVDRAASA